MITVSKYTGLILLVLGLVMGGSMLSIAQAEQNNIQQLSNAIKQDRFNGLEEKIEGLLQQLTLDEKILLVHSNGKFSVSSIERLGIHELWLSDGPHGVREETARNEWLPAGWNDDHATYLPPLIAIASSWDKDLARRHGEVLGSESRHRRKDIILGPGVNMARLPINGRTFEYMGEDPYLAATLVVPEIQGIQSKDVAACVKHYALNTQEKNRRKWNANPDERTLREIYLPAFEAAVKEGGVYSVMGSYNSIRGEQASQNKHLIDILKKEWGFDGVLMTDWNVLINDFDAANNGLDLEMGTNAPSYDEFKMARALRDHVRAGRIPLSVLNDKVRRMLRLQFRIGMMDEYRMGGQRNTKAHHQVTYDITAGATVLLKNDDNFLPLNKKKLKKILVIGPNADKKHSYGGGSSAVKTLYEITPLQGLQEALGDAVEIEIMQVGNSENVIPISSNYIESRDPGAGIPAWNAIFYKDKTRTDINRSAWFADSAYRWVPGKRIQYFSLFGDIKPKSDGEHLMKFSGKGKLRLLVDGQLKFKGEFTNAQIQTLPLQLTANKVHKFELQYEGRHKFDMGWVTPDRPLSTKEQYLSAAKSADAVIYFGGLSHEDDREGKDRVNLQLSQQQDRIIEQLLAVNNNTVVFLIGGSPVEMPWLNKANSVLWGWYGGNEAGRAYADILLGKVNPSGKLPLSFPKKLSHSSQIALNDYNDKASTFPEGVFIGYRWFEQQKIAPLFSFGHGLSYTEYHYSDLKLSHKVIDNERELTAEISITNTGNYQGKEVVQLYLADLESSVPRPIKELKGFSKVSLKAGESQRVKLILKSRDLAFWDSASNNWAVESGIFRVMVGSSSADIRQSADFEIRKIQETLPQPNIVLNKKLTQQDGK